MVCCSAKMYHIVCVLHTVGYMHTETETYIRSAHARSHAQASHASWAQ
eukprot:COSAG01_NODE_158_length_23708_cov_7.921979_14_plen_48_part_00